jgi:PQQ-dependent dehydrogenase (s-GDH family)
MYLSSAFPKLAVCSTIGILIHLTMFGQSFKGANGERFTMQVLAEGLQDPWQLRLDSSGNMWITESRGLRVLRMNIQNRSIKTMLDLSGLVNYKRYDTINDLRDGGKPWPAGGLMGLALHPDFHRGEPFIFLNYINWFEGADSTGKGCRGKKGGCFFTAKLVRYRFDSNKQILTDPIIIADSIPASNDHNGSRILIAPVDGKNYLFYAIGDMGAGQFDNAGRNNHSQDTGNVEGKILRFNITPDSVEGEDDQWIPNDNPFDNAIWTYGHRNPQGLYYAVISNTGLLFSSEHGPYSDDEINIIQKGRNYGHPLVIGYADGNYDGLSAGVTADSSLPNRWHSSYPDIFSESANAVNMGKRFAAPIISLYPNSKSSLLNLFREISKDEKSKQEWRSEAPSSIAIYTHNKIPGWKNSVILPCLKTGRVLRLKLSDDGSKIVGDTIAYFSSSMRYRDIAISADGGTIYLAVDNSQVTSGPSENNKSQTAHKGAIIALRYMGQDTRHPDR